MSTARVTVLLHAAPPGEELIELVDRTGYDFIRTDWSPVSSMPRVLIADESPTSAPDWDQISPALADGTMTLIWLGNPSEAPQARKRIDLPMDVDSGQLATIVELADDIAKLYASCAREHHECQRWIELAMRDPLTGLPNRRAFDAALAEQLAGRSPLCVALLDVDHFKRINDTENYAVGDRVLRQAASTMRKSTRQDDIVARLGGDEFGLIIRHVNVPLAAHVLDRLRRTVSQQLQQSGLPTATLSAGFVAVGPDDARESSAIYAATAECLRQAKQQHRDRCVGHAVSQRRPSHKLRDP